MHMEYKASAKYVRTSPRKLRLIGRAVSGKSVDAAVAALAALAKPTVEPLLKLILSARANAVLKKAVAENLVITSIDVTDGPALKRWHAASRGMAHAYKKRMSHVTVTLQDKEKGK